jgi:hypothetical protein
MVLGKHSQPGWCSSQWRFSYDVSDIETDNNVEQWAMVENTVPDPLADDGNFGINYYCMIMQ